MLYQTGFEPPAYTAGVLSGQNGWGGSPGVVENSFAFSGTQAVEYDSSAAANQYLNFHAVPDTPADPTRVVTVSVEAYFTGNSNEV